MPRSGKEARLRLQQATLELFRERGYDATTTAEIAARAGVTERTFFRHFADKREALFDGEEIFRATIAGHVQTAPEALDPVAAMLWAFRAVAPMLEANRPFTEPRRAVIAVSPALQERVLTKTAALTSGVSAALQRRGVAPSLSVLVSQVGMAAFDYAANAWFNDPAAGLTEHLTRAFTELGRVSSARPP